MRRNQIMEAAAKVFSQKGYYHTKMQEIADEAGIGKGTVYEYFNSKEALFIELIKIGTQKLADLTHEELTQPRPLWMRLYGMMKRHVDFLWENRDFACLVLGRESQVVTENQLYGLLVQVREDLLKQFENTFKEAMEKGEVVNGDPVLYAKIFHGLGTQVIVSSVLMENKKPTRTELEEIIQILMNGIRKEQVEPTLEE